MHDLNDMVAFAKVVEEGGFTAAAERIGLPKSNMSRRVSRLEQKLGVRLLERTTRKIHLTEIGDIYYQHCQRILAEAEHAERCVDRLSSSPRGLIRISASTTVGQQLLSPVLAEFLSRYPEIKLQLMLSNRRVDLIEEGFDVAIRMGPLEDSSLVARQLGQSNLFFFTSPEYVKREGSPHGPDDLSTHSCLVMSELEIPERWQLIGPDSKRALAISPYAIVNDFVTLRRMVRDGCGITILPDYLTVKDEHEGRLVRVLPDWSLKSVQFHAVYPSHRGATPKVRALIDFLIEKFTSIMNENS